MTSANVINLKNANSEVLLCPDIGAAIARYTWRGHSVLRRAPDSAIEQGLVRQMGAYALMPYSNRIARAKLVVGDKRYVLRQNFPPELHAVHGFGWQRAWQVLTSCVDSARLTLRHAADNDWPFACEAKQHIQLSADGLRLTISVCNLDDAPMPAGLGFHPFFPTIPAAKLQAEWKGMWKMDAESLPTEWVETPASADFRQLRSVEGWKVDNCFTGWGRQAVIEYPTHRTTIEASSNCQQLICYAPDDGRNFMALEPVSHINDGFNLAAKGVADTGMQLLGRGDSMEVSMTVSMQEMLPNKGTGKDGKSKNG